MAWTRVAVAGTGSSRQSRPVTRLEYKACGALNGWGVRVQQDGDVSSEVTECPRSLPRTRKGEHSTYIDTPNRDTQV